MFLVKAVAGATTTNIVYDPLGRLFEYNQGTTATTRRFVTDGDAIVQELNGSNGLAERFVHGSNAAADDPLLWYGNAGSGLTGKMWLHADHLGSIVARTDASGGNPAINSYDEYGIPGAANTGRFQYTGQVWLSQIGLYYYKARFYSPYLGRFMQTDPVGYKDQINLYAYVSSDPVNSTDPTGLECDINTESHTVMCTIKVVIPPGQKELTKEQRAEGQRIANSYARTVANLLSTNRTAQVGPTGGRPGTSFKIDSKTVGQELAARTIYFRPGQSNRDNAMNTGGMNPFYGAKNFTNVFQPATRLFDIQQQVAFAHEGIHNTETEYRGNFLAPFLGEAPYRQEHQTPYDNAAEELLGLKP